MKNAKNCIMITSMIMFAGCSGGGGSDEPGQSYTSKDSNYLVGRAGVLGQSTLSFANGAQSSDARGLVVVKTGSTDPAVQIETPGAVPALTPLLYAADVDASSIKSLRARFALYFKQSSLYKLDLDAAPAPSVLSTLTPAEVCGQNGSPSVAQASGGNDMKNPQNSWVFFRASGPDGKCFTADDDYRAVKLSMSSTDAPLTVSEPVVERWETDGSLKGFVVRQGSEIVLVDAALSNPSRIFSITGADFVSYGLAMGKALPGIWLFKDANKLYGYDLSSSSGTPTEILALGSGEKLDSVNAVDEAGTAYLALNTSSTARLVSVNSAFKVTELASISKPVEWMGVTPTRLVMRLATGALYSLPRTGGTAPTVLVEPVDPWVLSTHYVVGENVHSDQFQIDAESLAIKFKYGVIRSDGSALVETANAAIVGSVGALASGLFQAGSQYAVLLAEGLTDSKLFAGSALKAINGTDRSVLKSYGTFSESPAAMVYASFDSPQQYGQSGLLAFSAYAVDSDSNPATDLYQFKSDSAGLHRVTQYITTTAASSGRVFSLAESRSTERVSQVRSCATVGRVVPLVMSNGMRCSPVVGGYR